MAVIHADELCYLTRDAFDAFIAARNMAFNFV
jgi:hypothetical protein